MQSLWRDGVGCGLEWRRRSFIPPKGQRPYTSTSYAFKKPGICDTVTPPCRIHEYRPPRPVSAEIPGSPLKGCDVANHAFAGSKPERIPIFVATTTSNRDAV